MIMIMVVMLLLMVVVVVMMMTIMIIQCTPRCHEQRFGCTPASCNKGRDNRHLAPHYEHRNHIVNARPDGELGWCSACKRTRLE